MSALLEEFIDHGILPFVGRSAEVERVMAFWRSTAELPGIRTALLVGEAGIGKSRLVEECVPRIAREGGSVLHIKLYPESTASILPLVTRAFRFSGSRRGAVTDGGDDTLASVTAELRRLARLRSTVLIVEDIHLLGGETLAEFGRLVEALADDPIAILALARPVELPAREVLAPYMAEEIPLRDLAERDLAILWNRLFQSTPDPAILRLLVSSTHGNPLAIRSALRGAIRAGAIVHDKGIGVWRVAVPRTALEQTLKRNVELLSEGMVALLGERERRAAARLASLGEIFPLEAADALLPEAPEVIEALVDKGLLVQPTTPAAPLPGSIGGGTVIAFTHTILHTYLAAQKGAEPAELIDVIASELPLYSILPFQILAREARTAAPPREKARRAIMRALELAVALDASADWKLGIEAWRGAEGIGRICRTIWSDEEERMLRAELLVTRLKLMRRHDTVEAYEGYVEELLRITEEPLPASLRKYRLRALCSLHALGRKKDPEMCRQTWRRAQEFIAAHPELKLEMEYIAYLEAAARSMIFLEDRGAMKRIEELLLEASRLEEATEEYRAMAKEIVAFNFLDTFASEEELETRLRLMREVEPMVTGRRKMNFMVSKLILFYDTGRMRELLEAAAHTMAAFKEQGLDHNYYHSILSRHCALAALGGEFEGCAREIEDLCAAAPKEMEPFVAYAQNALAEQALLCGAEGWLRDAIERGRLPREGFRADIQVVLTLELGTPPEALAAVAEEGSEPFKPLVKLLIDPEPLALHPALKGALDAPVLRIADLLEKRAALDAIPELARRLTVPKLAAAFESAMGDALLAALRWLDERRLGRYIEIFLDRHGALLPAETMAAWRERAAAYAGDRSHLSGTEGARKLHLTMLGTIELRLPNGEEIPIRGARLRTLLGLMVADRMAEEPLEHREFSAIVADTDDPDKARKTLNGVVFRLREIVGHDAILTQEETPKLNTALVDVDLLEAHEALKEAETAMREGSLLRAQRKLLQVLAVTRGAVAFPSLYENFFETVRDTFENALRSLLLKVAKGLLAEGDPQNAEELLRGGFTAMAGDEELAELLCEAFIMLGKRTEAERVRMRMGMEEG